MPTLSYPVRSKRYACQKKTFSVIVDTDGFDYVLLALRNRIYTTSFKQELETQDLQMTCTQGLKGPR